MSQASLINRLQKPWPKNTVNFHCRSNNGIRKLFVKDLSHRPSRLFCHELHEFH